MKELTIFSSDEGLIKFLKAEPYVKYISFGMMSHPIHMIVNQ